MKLKKLLKVAIFAALASFVFGSPYVPAYADSNVSVRVKKDQITPDTLNLAPGTTVNWINSGDSPIRVRFLSNAVSTNCKAPRGFVPDKDGIMVSQTIPAGQVASLCFLEKEKYPYEVEFLGDEQSAKSEHAIAGTVQVQ